MPRSTHDPRIPSYIVYLITMCAFATALLVLLLADLDGQFEVPRGVYSALAAAICVTGMGYLVRSEGYRIRLYVAAQIEGPRGPDADATVRLTPGGLDPEAIQAARSVARRLLPQWRELRR